MPRPTARSNRPPWSHDERGSSGVHGGFEGPPWWTRQAELDPRRGRWPSFVFALVVTGLFGLIHAVLEPRPLGWLGYAAGVVAVLALLLVDHWPGPAVVIVGALAISSLVLVSVPPFALLPLLVAIVRSVRRGAVWWAAATAASTLVLPTVFAFGDTPRLVVPGIVCVMAAGIVLGVSLGARARRDRMRSYRASLEERRQTEAERERVRIARELHDVLAHSLSSISVQAGVAIHLAETQPERAAQTLRDIRETSTSALAEVRQVLGVLRGDEAAELEPEPDLDGLPALEAEATRLGLGVTIADVLEPRPIATVQLALYRIVREALTNAARHAPGARVSVELRWEGTVAVAEVINGGAETTPEASNGSGRGILGMRERAALLGGTLEAGARGRGFAVIARIPTAHEERLR